MLFFTDVPVKSSFQNTPTIAVSWHDKFHFLGVATANGVVAGEKIEEANMSRSVNPTSLAWNPNKGMLVSGWKDGSLLLYNSEKQSVKREKSIHTKPIIKLQWTPNGKRLVTIDEEGKIGIWKTDTKDRLTLLCSYDVQEPIQFVVFRKASVTLKTAGEDSTTISNPPTNPINDLQPKTVEQWFFFFGSTNSGIVRIADDTGNIKEAFNVGAPLVTLLFFEERSHIVVITQTAVLAMYYIGDNEISPKLKMKVKISLGPGLSALQNKTIPQPATSTPGTTPATAPTVPSAPKTEINAIWVGKGLMATCSSEHFVRLWDFETDDNYILTPNLIGNDSNNQSGIGAIPKPISSILFNTRKRVICGVCEDYLYFWQFFGSTSGGGTKQSDWEYIGSYSKKQMIKDVAWGPGEDLLAVSSTDTQQVFILQETLLKRKMRGDWICVQTGEKQISVASISKKEVYSVDSDITIKSYDILKGKLSLTNGNRVLVHDAQTKERNTFDLNGKSISSLALHNEGIFFCTKDAIEIHNTQGTKKQTLPFNEETEGNPILLDIAGEFVVAATTKNEIKTWQLTGREAKAVGEAKNICVAPKDSKLNKSTANSPKNEENKQSINSESEITEITSIKLNSNGKKVAVLTQKVYGDMIREPTTTVTVVSVFEDKIDTFDFGSRGVYPISIFWDETEPKLLSVECRSFGSKQNKAAKVVCTIWSTPDNGLLFQDSFDMDRQFSCLIGTNAPNNYFLTKESLPEQASLHATRPMKDFEGINVADNTTKEALLSFSYFLAIGNMEEAYKCVKAIKDENVWTNLAQMCVKTRKMTIAEICLGNMKNASAAAALREAKKEPELEAQVAILAIYLNMIDEAEQLYKECKRYDLLCSMYQKLGKWDEAIAIAEQFDKIHIKSLQFSYAKHLESLGNYDAAMIQYENSGNASTEIPRMLLSCQQIKKLKTYVSNSNDPKLFHWWGNYCEGANKMKEAIKYYTKCNDILSLVRIHCILGNLKAASEIVMNAEDNPKYGAACFYLAKEFEAKTHTKQAIEFFLQAKVYIHAVRLAIEKEMDQEIMQIALKAEPASLTNNNFPSSQSQFLNGPSPLSAASLSNFDVNSSIENFLHDDTANQKEKKSNAFSSQSDQVKLLAAQYFEEKNQIDKAVVLYTKGGFLNHAVNICFTHRLFDALGNIIDLVAENPKNTDAQTLMKCGEFFIENGYFDKAVGMFVTAGEYAMALDLCIKKNVKLTETIGDRMTPPAIIDQTSGNETEESKKNRNEIILKIATIASRQGQYQLATKKFVQAGDKVKAMKCLIRSGDTEKIIFFANISKKKEIYVLAANYLQTLEWSNDTKIMKSIITFYGKALAWEKLSNFYESCSQLEINEYRDYEKGIAALNDALKYLLKETSENGDGESNNKDLQNRIAHLKNKILLFEKFLAAKNIVSQDPVEMLKLTKQLLEEPEIDEVIRIGDIFALQIESFCSKGNFKSALECVDKMKKMGIALNHFVSQQQLKQIYAVAAPPAAAATTTNNSTARNSASLNNNNNNLSNQNPRNLNQNVKTQNQQPPIIQNQHNMNQNAAGRRPQFPGAPQAAGSRQPQPQQMIEEEVIEEDEIPQHSNDDDDVEFFGGDDVDDSSSHHQNDDDIEEEI